MLRVVLYSEKVILSERKIPFIGIVFQLYNNMRNEEFHFSHSFGYCFAWGDHFHM